MGLGVWEGGVWVGVLECQGDCVFEGWGQGVIFIKDFLLFYLSVISFYEEIYNCNTYSINYSNYLLSEFHLDKKT